MMEGLDIKTLFITVLYGKNSLNTEKFTILGNLRERASSLNGFEII